jgi:hypothetical protein
MKKRYEANGVSFYDIFNAGVTFVLNHPKHDWSEEERTAALEAALPKKILAQINDEHREKSVAAGK